MDRVEAYAQVIFSGGRPPDGLLAEDNEYLWEYFREIQPYSPGRPEVITFRELEAYQKVTGRKLYPHEVAAIRRMSRAYVDETIRRSKTPRSGRNPSGEPTLKRVVAMNDVDGLKSLFRR